MLKGVIKCHMAATIQQKIVEASVKQEGGLWHGSLKNCSFTAHYMLNIVSTLIDIQMKCAKVDLSPHPQGEGYPERRGNVDTQQRQQVINRLKSAMGHLNGVISMLEEDRYCIDVIKQIDAVQAALEKSSQLLLENHLHHCVITAIRGDEPEERERVLAEIMDVFKNR